MSETLPGTKRKPITELRNGGRHLVWLDPERYTPAERMYVAARVTRCLTQTPDEMLAAFYDRQEPAAMVPWLRHNIASEWHDSVLEFAGLEYTVWISGVSLGTIRDVDRHRRFSYEEYTTRALGASLKAKLPLLQAVGHLATEPMTDAQEAELTELFYVHPSMYAELSPCAVRHYLSHCADALRLYIEHTQDSSKPHAADIYRGAIPLALKTPFLMGGNQRDWFEAAGKRGKPAAAAPPGLRSAG